MINGGMQPRPHDSSQSNHMLDNILDSQSDMGELSRVRVFDQAILLVKQIKLLLNHLFSMMFNKEFPLFKDLIDLCDEYPEF